MSAKGDAADIRDAIRAVSRYIDRKTKKSYKAGKRVIETAARRIETR